MTYYGSQTQMLAPDAEVKLWTSWMEAIEVSSYSPRVNPRDLLANLSGIDVHQIPVRSQREIDTDRTGFRLHEGQQECLKRVLRAYSIYDPHVGTNGYCQEMAQIVSFLIVVSGRLREAADVFRVFAFLMEHYGLRAFLFPPGGLSGDNGCPMALVYCQALRRVVRSRLPLFHTHLSRYVPNFFQPGGVAHTWFTTLFTNDFQPSVLEAFFTTLFSNDPRGLGGFQYALCFAFCVVQDAALRFQRYVGDGVNQVLAEKFLQDFATCKRRTLDNWSERDWDCMLTDDLWFVEPEDAGVRIAQVPQPLVDSDADYSNWVAQNVAFAAGCSAVGGVTMGAAILQFGIPAHTAVIQSSLPFLLIGVDDIHLFAMTVSSVVRRLSVPFQELIEDGSLAIRRL